MFGIVTQEIKPVEVGEFPIFGLNSNCIVKDISYVQGVTDSIGVTIDVNGYDIKQRYFEPNKVFDRSGVEITDTNSELYKQGIVQLKNELSSVINHIMGAIVGIDQWHHIVSKGFASFVDYAKKCEHTFNHAHKPVNVDVFLQYSRTAKDGKKYLQLPRTTKSGAFICKATGVNYTPVESDKGLSYVNGEKLHPFVRNKWFMNSELAKKGGATNVVSTPSDVLPF